MKIERVEEFQLSSECRGKIARLLQEGFGVYPAGQSYYKQLPSFRYLAWDEEHLIGHLAVEHRIIKVGEVILPILGIADLCVTPSRQQERIATKMLHQLEKSAIAKDIDFLLLTGSEPNVYESLGFLRLERSCRWLLINNFQTMGVMRRMVNNIMVKAIGDQVWPEGEIDLLGHIF